MDLEDEEDVIVDIREQIFHSTVRENIIFLLLFLLLYLGSFAFIGRFRRRDREDLFSTDEDEILVYRISLWMCTFSLAVAIGAVLLLPISIASNEVLLLYPNSYYVKWLNSSLIQGLWNHVFLFSNLSLFVFLPFAYLFSESAGFAGHKTGIISRAYETFTVLSLLAVFVLGMTCIISALIDPERSGFQQFFQFGSYHLPFLYSCVSFLGVILLLVCTPLGFVRLFGVVGQVLVKPHLLRDVNDEYDSFNLEEAFLKRKMNNTNNNKTKYEYIATYDPLPSNIISYNTENLQQRKNISKNGIIINNGRNSSNGETPPNHNTPNTSVTNSNGGTTTNSTPSSSTISTPLSAVSKLSVNGQNNLSERLRELKSDKEELDKLRSSSAFQRNFVYPIAMLLLLFLTGLTVLIVIQNTLELLIGIKALPLSTRQFTLGITSLSKLGPLGAGLEVLIIFYLGTTSSVGLYTMPFMRSVRPKRRKTSLSQLIVNCALVLILSSAQPLLSRILGITNFDLLGDFGAIEWLGNFQIVLLYNLIFGTATTLCLMNKFTATVRRELCARLRSFFGYNLISITTTTTTSPPPTTNITDTTTTTTTKNTTNIEKPSTFK